MQNIKSIKSLAEPKNEIICVTKQQLSKNVAKHFNEICRDDNLLDIGFFE